MGFAIVLLCVLSIVFLIGVIINEIIELSAAGFPPKDKDVLEFIEKVRKSNPAVTKNFLSSGYTIISCENPTITTSNRTFLLKDQLTIKYNGGLHERVTNKKLNKVENIEFFMY